MYSAVNTFVTHMNYTPTTPLIPATWARLRLRSADSRQYSPASGSTPRPAPLARAPPLSLPQRGPPLWPTPCVKSLPLPEVTDVTDLEVLATFTTCGPTVWDSAKPTNAHPGCLCSRGASARDAFEPAGFARPVGAGGCLAERRAAGLIDTVRLWVTAMRDDMSPRHE